MPYYDFKCAKHGVFEVRLGMSEVDDQQVCPKCSEPAVRKFHKIRRIRRRYAGQILDPDMNETQATDTLYNQIEEHEEEFYNGE
jgi:putative FmdB family regulatory protein